MNGKWLKGLTPLVAAAALIAGPSLAWATPLPPGGSVSPSIVNGTGVSSGFTILADSGWQSSSTGNPAFGGGTGQVREIVVSGDTNNPSKGLDFIYQLQNTSSTSSAVSLAALNAFTYGSFSTDVVAANPGASSFSNSGNSFSAPTTGGGSNPTSATRSSNGTEVSFNFGSSGNGTLAPGSYSDLLIVRTNAPNYSAGIFDFSDGGTSSQLNGFDPAAAPEPASVILLAGCLACLGVAGVWPRRKGVPVVS
ncbi:MAG: hypothetical protein ACYC3I_14435 [Gemmataceae bacterium]